MKDSSNLADILGKEHERKWVALARDHSHVVAYHESLVELDKQIAGRDVVYMKVPASDVYLTS